MIAFLASIIAGYFLSSLIFPEKGCERGITLLNGQIMDTGSPEGGPAPDRAPTKVPFLNMNNLYKNNNVIYTKDGIYIYPARNNMIIGSPIILPLCSGPEATYHAFGKGFDKEYPQNGCGNARADAVNHPGQDGQGFCGCGFRNILLDIGGKQILAMIDSGLNSAIISPDNARRLGLVGKQGVLQAKILPSQIPISSAWHIQDDLGNEKITFPIYAMVQTTNIILTRDYTIIESDGRRMIYDCKSNQVVSS